MTSCIASSPLVINHKQLGKPHRGKTQLYKIKLNGKPHLYEGKTIKLKQPGKPHPPWGKTQSYTHTKEKTLNSCYDMWLSGTPDENRWTPRESLLISHESLKGWSHITNTSTPCTHSSLKFKKLYTSSSYTSSLHIFGNNLRYTSSILVAPITVFI